MEFRVKESSDFGLGTLRFFPVRVAEVLEGRRRVAIQGFVVVFEDAVEESACNCLLYTSPSPRDA